MGIKQQRIDEINKGGLIRPVSHEMNRNIGMQLTDGQKAMQENKRLKKRIEELEQRLKTGQHETIVIRNLQGKVLMHNGQFVNEYMLHRGIYSTQKPTIHWDENLDIEKYISEHWFVRETMEVEYPTETYENIRKCEFVSVTLKVDQ